MSAKNNCSFKTRLGRDAEVRFTPSGKAVMGFSIPIESGWGESKKVAWCECSLWGKKAEGKLIDHMKKGQEIIILGEIGMETYQAKDGTERTKMTLNVSDIDLIGGRNEQPSNTAPQRQNQHMPAQGGQQYQQGTDPFAYNVPVDDDLPF